VIDFEIKVKYYHKPERDTSVTANKHFVFGLGGKSKFEFINFFYKLESTFPY